MKHHDQIDVFSIPLGIRIAELLWSWLWAGHLRFVFQQGQVLLLSDQLLYTPSLVSI